MTPAQVHDALVLLLTIVCAIAIFCVAVWLIIRMDEQRRQERCAHTVLDTRVYARPMRRFWRKTARKPCIKCGKLFPLEEPGKLP